MFNKRHQKGVALVAVLFISVIFIIVMTLALTKTVFNSKVVNRNKQLDQGTQIADAAAQVAMSKIKRYIYDPTVNTSLKPLLVFSLTEKQRLAIQNYNGTNASVLTNVTTNNTTVAYTALKDAIRLYNQDNPNTKADIFPETDPSTGYDKTNVTTKCDATGVSLFDKLLPGETYDSGRNFTRFDFDVDDTEGTRKVPVEYRITNLGWVDDQNSLSAASVQFKVLAICYNIVGYKPGQTIGKGSSYNYNTDSPSIKSKISGVETTFQIVRSNLSKYGVFYVDDLAVANAGTMDFYGSIHTNSNAFLDSKGTLNLHNGITSAKHILRGSDELTAGSANTGTVNIFGDYGSVALTTSNDGINWTTTSGKINQNVKINNPAPPAAQVWTIPSTWASTAKSTWGTAVADSETSPRGETLPVPEFDDIKPDGDYAKKAGIFISTKTENYVIDGPKPPLKATAPIVTAANQYKTQEYDEIIDIYMDTDPDVVPDTSVPSTTYHKVIHHSIVLESGLGASSGKVAGTDTITQVSLLSNLKDSGNATVDPCTGNRFWDGRQKKDVSTTVIDVAKLQTVQGYPDDGLVYADRKDALIDQNAIKDPADYANTDPNRVPNGAMLDNGSVLTKPINFITSNPVYIQGDFNKHAPVTGTTAIAECLNSSNVAAACSSTTHPNPDWGNPAKDKWKPAIVMADAITILSNEWPITNNSFKPGISQATHDSTTKSPLFSPTNNIEVNTAMVTGDTPTQSASIDSGGLHNFPRFLESWPSSKTAKIRGSFIQLWHSKFATAPYKHTNDPGAYYVNPNRDWGYDNSYDNTLADIPASFKDAFPSTTISSAMSSWSQMKGDYASNLANNLAN